MKLSTKTGVITAAAAMMLAGTVQAASAAPAGGPTYEDCATYLCTIDYDNPVVKPNVVNYSIHHGGGSQTSGTLTYTESQGYQVSINGKVGASGDINGAKISAEIGGSITSTYNVGWTCSGTLKNGSKGRLDVYPQMDEYHFPMILHGPDGEDYNVSPDYLIVQKPVGIHCSFTPASAFRDAPENGKPPKN
ncbi:hypothetical protein [Amycolatopsis sp. NPDC004169]|uniref:hypothetical protein n=1 Tax=Amycolatopsis sp. NPDC004169 TaxID=3154453 RepID=UPI0033A92091